MRWSSSCAPPETGCSTRWAVEGGPPFHSVFCDSLEVFGADWTGRLLAEFERRRGYSLTPHLPALFGDAGPLTPHVRYDYHLTLSDLIIEEFFGPLAAWSARRGVKARVQAHGAMGDVMRGYGVADIPEGENIFLGDRYQVNLKHRRLASSAAHIYGKPVASAETYTWLRTPDLHHHARDDEGRERFGLPRRHQPGRQPRLLVFAARGGRARAGRSTPRPRSTTRRRGGGTTRTSRATCSASAPCCSRGRA